jgi:type VI secretion system protein ImpF
MTRVEMVEAAQSVWDRLCDEQQAPATPGSSLRILKESIRRDLEELLNTRCLAWRELHAYPLARTSVVNYGLEEYTGLTQDSAPLAVQDGVERCLKQYEPRLRDVRVSVMSASAGRREILLHIEAVLPVQPAVEIVLFDTMLDIASGLYQVK